MCFMPKKTFSILFFLMAGLGVLAQTSDDQFKKPLKQVISEIATRFDVNIRYSEDLVKDKWVSYADWRYKPDLEKTLTAVLASLDLQFSKEFIIISFISQVTSFIEHSNYLSPGYCNTMPCRFVLIVSRELPCHRVNNFNPIRTT